MEKLIITKFDLINMGYKKNTAQKIIRQSKIVLVKKGYNFYKNNRLGQVPISIVKEITGL